MRPMSKSKADVPGGASGDITFRELADHIGAGGKRPDTTTLLRWHRRGIKDTFGSIIRLEAEKRGGTYYTTLVSYQRFIGRINSPTPPVKKGRKAGSHEW